MDNNIDFSVAIDSVNRKIAEINIKMLEKKTKELEEELNKYITIKKEIYKGNAELIKKVVDSEI